jgi:glycosyltransferase involved in cell wall biosynthesis
MLSFIIPAHNEEKLLARTLESIQNAARSGDDHARPFEIIVADDASTDATRRVAEQAGARVISINRRHIAAARNAGAAAARGNVFIFVDADTTITAEVYRATLAALDNGADGGGSTVEFDPPVPLYARLMLPLAMWVNRTFHMAAGCYVYATRDAFTAVGGFDEALFAAEETTFSRAMKKVGRFHVVDASVMTSGRKLRAYSARTIFGTVLKLVVMALLQRRAFSNRKHFDLWYAPRRDDPKEQRPDSFSFSARERAVHQDAPEGGRSSRRR